MFARQYLILVWAAVLFTLIGGAPARTQSRPPSPVGHDLTPDVHPADYISGMDNNEFVTILSQLIETTSGKGTEPHIIKWPGPIKAMTIMDVPDNVVSVVAQSDFVLISNAIGQQTISPDTSANFLIIITRDVINSLESKSYISGFFDTRETYLQFIERTKIENKKCISRMSVSYKYEIRNYLGVVSLNQNRGQALLCLERNILSGFGVSPQQNIQIAFP